MEQQMSLTTKVESCIIGGGGWGEVGGTFGYSIKQDVATKVEEKIILD